MAQVVFHRHALGAGDRGNDAPVGRVQHRVQRQRRAIVAFGQGERIHHFIRQHGDLVARHIHSRHARTGDLVDRVVGTDAQARRRDVDADAHGAVVQFHDRERIVDLGGGDVVDRERGHVRQRQVFRRLRNLDRGETGAAREVLEQEAAHVQLFRRSQATDVQHQARRGGLQLVGRRFQRLVFDGVLVRLEQELLHDRAHRLRQLAVFQLVDIAGLNDGLLLLLFDAGQRSFQRLLGRRLVAATALLVEIDRRAVQRQHQAGGFVRQRRVAEVFGAQFGETEFFLAGDFPQEVEIDIRGDALGRVQQRLRFGFLELQQHVARLHLGALTARHLHLVGFTGLRQHHADLEVARFLKKYVHIMLCSSWLRPSPGPAPQARIPR